MQIRAVEEATLPQNEPEPKEGMREPAATKEQESTQPEPTALVPAAAEPEVIEGVVIEIEPPETPKDHPSPKETPYWLLIPFTIVCCLVFVAVSSLVPLLAPSATITIIPVEKTITTATTIQVTGRALPPLTLMQSMSIAATGKRHQEAKRAHGTITFYNGLFSSQTVGAGTILTGADGVQIITYQPAVIPATNPPYIGQVTIVAHAIIAGAQGNIPAGDISQQCCLTAVKAVNTQDFTGGQNAREYRIVTPSDIASAETSLTTILEKSERAALRAQLTIGEGILTPSCSKKVQSDHKAGEEASEVHVSVSQTCTAIAYLANTLMAGCAIQARPFTAQEASDAAVAVCNLGLENWPPHWLPANTTSLPGSFLVDHDLVTVFQVGWAVLHNNVSMYAAEQLIGVLTRMRCDDPDIQMWLDALRIRMAKHWRARAPWRARDALDVIAILDMTAWAVLLALIDECPVLHAAVGAKDSRTTSVSASDFEFISENSQIASVREFMQSLPERLRC